MIESKKKILFHYSMLNIGGAERSTLRLINILVKNEWEVTLVLNVGNGKLENKLDSRVKVVHFFPKPWKLKVMSQKLIFKKLTYLLLYGFPILFYTFYTFLKKYSFRFKNYDAAIISLQGLNPNFVCKHVNAKRKYLYLRNDLSQLKKEQIVDNIKNFNHVIDGYLCVSGTVKDSLDSINPVFKKKAHVLYNILGIEEVILLGNSEKNPYEDIPCEELILVTVCRMSNVSKGLFRQLDAAEILKKDGYKFKWFFVGDGSDLTEFKDRIAKKKLGDFIISLGEKENPYPFIKNADIVCVLSYYEGLSGGVNEGKILGRAVIATEFSGVYEQIIHKKNGIVVKNNLEAIIVGLRELFDNKALQLSIENNFIGSEIGNNDLKVEKLKKIISE